jgi:GAF domain-containing protein
MKSKVGTDIDAIPRDIAFCGHAILMDELMVVEDARLDERFADNPLVTGDTSVRFYAGAPLKTRDGYAMGSLCVLDRVPRTLTDDQKKALRALSRQVMAQMDHRRNTLDLAEILAERQQTDELKAAGMPRKPRHGPKTSSWPM